jgi:serine/threonine-protein kinase
VKVIDFGIARSTLATRKTTQGVVKGRIAYVSPEHLLSQPIDHRADVWAMGVVAWELLVRRRLFRARSLGETVDGLLRAEIPRPSSVSAEVPPELDWIVMKALSRDPAGRHATMAAMADALDGAIERHAGGVAPAEIAALVLRPRTF